MRILPKKTLSIPLLILLVIASSLLTYNLYREQVLKFLEANILSQDVITATNEKRTENKKHILQSNSLLTKAAQAKAEDMAAKGYFSHTSPDGKQFPEWIQEAGYDYLYAGENLAVKFTTLSSLINGWMNSEFHRENILSDQYSETGIGIAEGKYNGKKTTFYVQIFAEPKISLENQEKYNLHLSASETVESFILRFLPLY